MDTARSVWSSDKDLDLWSHLRTWMACGGGCAVLFGLAADPGWVEAAYVDGWGVWLASTLAWLTSYAPFSVAEAGIVGLVLAETWWALDALAEAGAGRRRWRNTAAAGLLHLVDVVAAGLVVFYLVWGVCYAREPLVRRMQWPDPPGRSEHADIAWLSDVTQAAVLRANAAYEALHGSSDAGRVTAVPVDLDVDQAVDVGFVRAGEAVGLPATFAASRGPAKVPLGSELMSWLGIGGIYIPFTGEANVNGGPPGWARVMTLAHEKSHQRMVASEDEASFVGFLACVYAEQPLLRYAGWEFAARQLLRAMVTVDPTGAVELRKRLSPGILRDQNDVASYWEPYSGPLEVMAEWMNDHYLKANRVAGGVQAYGRAGQLLMAFLQTDTGRAQLPVPVRPPVAAPTAP